MRPGIITDADARTATALVRRAEANRQAVARRLKDYPDRPFAKITAYDSTTGAYSWTEQTFDASGNRIDKPNGLSGTPSYMPAYSFGDSTTVHSLLPVEVQLRRTVLTATKGPAYEFPLYCGCTSFSGSGGRQSGASVITACCPSNTIPTTLYAHVNLWNAEVNLVGHVDFPLLFNHPICPGSFWWGYSDPVPICQYFGVIPRISASLVCDVVQTFPTIVYWFRANIACYFYVPAGCGNTHGGGVQVPFQCSPFVATLGRVQVQNCHFPPITTCTFADMTVNTTL